MPEQHLQSVSQGLLVFKARQLQEVQEASSLQLEMFCLNNLAHLACALGGRHFDGSAEAAGSKEAAMCSVLLWTNKRCCYQQEALL